MAERSHREWRFASKRDDDSWVAIQEISGSFLTTFDELGRERIAALSAKPMIYDIWGRGNSALVEFFLTCPHDDAVLVQLANGDLLNLSEFRPRHADGDMAKHFLGGGSE